MKMQAIVFEMGGLEVGITSHTFKDIDDPKEMDEFDRKVSEEVRDVVNDETMADYTVYDLEIEYMGPDERWIPWMRHLVRINKENGEPTITQFWDDDHRGSRRVNRHY